MIVSVSRRTDIPALYGEWFMRRLQEGFALVRNPYNPSRISRVSLLPDVVDCLVFWSKNPAPLLPLLPQMMGFPYCVQFTLTGYGAELEPGLPPLGERLDTFRRLVDMIGPKRVVWRYDPVILNTEYSVSRHSALFEELADALQGYTERCVFSFVDMYRKNRTRMRGVVDPSVDDATRRVLVVNMVEAAKERGIKLAACSEDLDLRPLGVEPSACIDKQWIEDAVGLPMQVSKDANQRKQCGCMESVDIGAYDSCSHFCRYCYANKSPDKVNANVARHDPASPLLLGWPDPLADITERAAKSEKIRQFRLA